MGNTTYTRETVFDDVRELRKGNMYDLYAFILERVVRDDAKEEQLMGCRKTLGILACQKDRQSIRTLTTLINSGRSFDVVHFFRRISSVIVSNFDVIDEESVPRPHKTFVDWIFFNYSASGNRFQVDIGLHLATRCIDIMNSELHFNMANVHSSAPYHPAVDPDRSQTLIPHSAIPAHIRYVCQNGFSHFYDHPTDNDEDNVLSSFVFQYTPKLVFFLQNTLLYWLEVRDNDSFDAWNDIWHLGQHNLILQESSAEVQSFLTQVQSFISHFGFGFGRNPPHIYVSALPFLPPDSLISIYHRATYPRTLNVKYDQDPQEKTIIYAAVVKGSLVAAISCPYSILMDSTLPEEDVFPATVLNVYDTRQKGRSLEVFSLPLSPVKLNLDNDTWETARNHTVALDLTTDGKYVAAGYDKIEVWNVDDGSSTVFHLTDDDSRTAIACLAFSPDGSRLAAGGYDGSGYVWDLKSQDSKRQFQCDKKTMIRKILFSCTDKSQMIVHLQDGTREQDGHIYVFELDTDSRSITNVPSDARLVSFASSDWAAYKSGDDFGFFECKNWNTYKMKLTNHAQYRNSVIEASLLGVASVQVDMHSIGVSSDGRIAVIGDGFLLSVWDVKADRFLGHMVGHSHSISVIAVQVLKSCDNDSELNGKYSCISVSHDGTIRVWDLNPLLDGETYFMEGWTSCLVSSPSFSGTWGAYGSWIKNKEGDYLFSIPLHCPFRHPLNTLVIGQCPELDMTHFVYGEEWTKCREPILTIEDEGKASGPPASESESGEPGPSNNGN
jgi:WD40 repeat protein